MLAGRGGEKGLLELLERAKANGVDARIIDREEIDKIQDGVNPEIVSALYAKDAGIVSPYKLTIALCDRAILNGAEVRLEENIESIRFDKKFIVKTQSGEYESKYLVNSAGGGASDINALLSDETYETAFRKGEYFVLDKTEGARVKTVLFPLPDENGKGILVAPTADGNVIYGPTSEACEEDDTSCTAKGLDLVRQGVSKVFANPNYRAVIREYAGVRAVIGEDFIVKRSEKYHDFFILAGICSPGLTSAPSIGKYIADEIEKEYKVEKPENPVKVLHHDRLKNLTAEELNEKVKKSEMGQNYLPLRNRDGSRNRKRDSFPVAGNNRRRRKTSRARGYGQMSGRILRAPRHRYPFKGTRYPRNQGQKGGKGSELVKCRIKEDN